VDPEGNALSLTQSINYYFGSGGGASTGILLNDTLDDFAIAPGTPNAFGLVGSEANAVAGDKIPLSSMTRPSWCGGETLAGAGEPRWLDHHHRGLQVLLNRASLASTWRLRRRRRACTISGSRIGIELEDRMPRGPHLRAPRARPFRELVSKLGNVNAVEVASTGAMCRRRLTAHGASAGF